MPPTRSTNKRRGAPGGGKKKRRKTNAPKPLPFNEVVRPFWDDVKSPRWSSWVWQCHADVVDTKSQACHSGSSKRLAQAPSWHSAKCQTLPSSPPSNPPPTPLHDIISRDAANRLAAAEDAPAESTFKVRRYRIYPTTDQKNTLNRYFGAARWTYNELVELGVRRGGFKFPPTPKLVRVQAVNKASLVVKGRKDIAESCPAAIRGEAAYDYIKAVKTSLALKKVGRNGKTPSKFRRRNDPQQSIVIHKRYWGAKTGYYAMFNRNSLRAHQRLPAELTADSRLVRTRLGHYYLCMPEPIEVRGENQAPSSTAAPHSTIALDPGVRSFVTGFDADGGWCKWGADDMERLLKDCQRLDELLSLQATGWHLNHRKRQRLAVRARRLRLKIRNRVDEMHRRLAKWLCESYRCVLLPRFDTQRMICKDRRKIRTKTARGMCTWAHYRFRQRLLAKSREYPWCRVVITAEPYTSKTCGSCGHLHTSLGGAKKYVCQVDACKDKFDRDLNGARNILVRHLTLHCDEPVPAST